MPLALIASSLALVSLIFEQCWGWFLEHWYERHENDEAAFEKGIKWKQRARTAAILLLAVSSIFQVTSDTRELRVSHESPESNPDSLIKNQLTTLSQRVAKVEDHLWPPEEPGGRPIDPKKPPPYGPSSSDLKIDALSKRLDDLSAVMATHEDIRVIRRKLIELQHEVAQLKEETQMLQHGHGAPAG